LVKKRSKYRYFDEIKWAEAFMGGELRFRSLSHFKQIEDGEVRGDAAEGSISYKPEAGLVMYHQRLGKTFTFPRGAFGSGVKTEEIFVLCASNHMGDDLQARFNAKACVQIMRQASFRQRIQYELPRTATFLDKPVDYYSPAEEPGARWALPELITFSKINSYAWQDEYRYAFSLTDALKYGSTSQQVVIPNQPPGNAIPPPPPAAHHYDIKVKALGSICKLHVF
jgi:hypothetical protein